MKLLFLLKFCVCLFVTSVCEKIDENQFFPPNCETSSDVIETVLRNRQNILSINSSQWRDKIKKTLYPNPTYFFNYKINLYETQRSQMIPILGVERNITGSENFMRSLNYIPSYVTLTSTQKDSLLEFVFPTKCLHINYTTYYGDGYNTICDSHFNVSAKMEFVDIHMNYVNWCDDRLTSEEKMIFGDDYNITWYKDCCKLSTGYQQNCVKGINKVTDGELILYEDEYFKYKSGIYFCEISNKNVSIIRKILNIKAVDRWKNSSVGKVNNFKNNSIITFLITYLVYFLLL